MSLGFPSLWRQLFQGGREAGLAVDDLSRFLRRERLTLTVIVSRTIRLSLVDRFRRPHGLIDRHRGLPSRPRRARPRRSGSTRGPAARTQPWLRPRAPDRSGYSRRSGTAAPAPRTTRA